MNGKNWKGVIVVGVFFVVFSNPVFAVEPNTVLLVRDSSDFKDALAEELLSFFVEADMDVVEKNSMRFLKKADLSDYSGIVVVNTGVAGKPHPQVRAFLERDETLPPTVVITTYSTPSRTDYIYIERPELDGLTSASLDNEREIQDLAGDIVSRLGF